MFHPCTRDQSRHPVLTDPAFATHEPPLRLSLCSRFPILKDASLPSRPGVCDPLPCAFSGPTFQHASSTFRETRAYVHAFSSLADTFFSRFSPCNEPQKYRLYLYICGNRQSADRFLLADMWVEPGTNKCSLCVQLPPCRINSFPFLRIAQTARLLFLPFR